MGHDKYQKEGKGERVVATSCQALARGLEHKGAMNISKVNNDS